MSDFILITKAKFADIVYDAVERRHKKVFITRLSGAWGCEDGPRLARFADVIETDVMDPGGHTGIFRKELVYLYELDCPWKEGTYMIRKDLNPPCGVSNILLLQIRFTGQNLCNPDDTSPCFDPDADDPGQCPDVDLTYQGDDNPVWTGSVCWLKGELDFVLHPPSSPGGNWTLTLTGCDGESLAFQTVCKCALVLFRPWAVPSSCCATNPHVPRDVALYIRSYIRPPAARFIDVVSRVVTNEQNQQIVEKYKVLLSRTDGCRRCSIPTAANIPCCPPPGLVSTILQLTITDSSCIPDQTFTIVYDPDNGFWQGTGIGAEGTPGKIVFACNPGGSSWSLQADGGFQFLFGGTSSGPCRPMLQIFHAQMVFGACGGTTLTITITEVPS